MVHEKRRSSPSKRPYTHSPSREALCRECRDTVLAPRPRPAHRPGKQGGRGWASRIRRRKKALLTCRWPERSCWESSEGVRSRGSWGGNRSTANPGCPPAAAAPLPTEPLNEPLPLFFASCHVMFNSGPAVPALAAAPHQWQPGGRAGAAGGRGERGRGAPGPGDPEVWPGEAGAAPSGRSSPAPERRSPGPARSRSARFPPVVSAGTRHLPRVPAPPRPRKSFCETLLGTWEGPGWDLCA